uniref:Cytospin-A n=1 Tax=Phallusia mammillata TaxID=59560 RepID=A0A6F9DAB8_9ASCI|nr:cytospin-A [Phallusia mammillata]
MYSGTRRNQQLAAASTASKTPSHTTGLKTKSVRNNSQNSSSGMSLSSSARSQSQEDLTRSKERPTRSKYIPGSSTSGTTASSRRMGATKDATKVGEKSREKSKPSSTKSTSSTTSSSGRSTSAISRRQKDAGSKLKSEVDKVALESKIKDLMSLAKAKDSEISSLKSKLDQMMHLLKRQQEEEDFGVISSSSPKLSASHPPSFTSLVKLSSEEGGSHSGEESPTSIGDIQNELSRLQDENAKLREQMDAMMTAMKQKESEKSLILNRQHTLGHDIDTLSNDDGLSSSLDDLASAASGDALQSTSVSRSTSTENLLDDGSISYSHSASRSDDKTSEGGISESSSVTVACLTERIHRMEESHISTNEELEATVQELTDLQKSVPELTIDNDRLQKEKDYLLEKLAIAEKKLSEQASESEHLRALVTDHLNDDTNHSDLKQQYVHLLNEREQLIQIQESMSKELRVSEEERKKAQELGDALKERLRHLERELSKSNTEKSMLDKRLKETKACMEEEHSDVIQKLEEELRKERQRIIAITGSLHDDESGKNMLELMDALQSEKQDLEDKFLMMEEDFTHCQHENERFDARIADLEEELEATNAKSKKDLSELSELIDRLQEDSRMKQANLDEVNETLFVMEDSVEQHIAVKKHDNHIIQQLNNQISNLKEERFRLEKEIQQLKKEQRTQTEEWKQFQADLQMAVMIANDMKAETQAEVARLREDNQNLDETVTKLRVENEQLRRRRVSSVSASSAAILEAAALRQGVGRSSVESNIAVLRETYKRRTGETSPGVQSLIKSFDSQASTPVPGEAPSSPTRAQPPLVPANSVPADLGTPAFSPSKTQAPKMGQVPVRAGSSPITATVSPMQRHHSMSSITTSMSQGGTPPSSSFATKLQTSSNGDSAASSKPGTPDSNRSGVAGTDLSQLSTLLRRNSTQEPRKTSTDGRKPQMPGILDRLGPSTPGPRHPPSSLPPATPVTPVNTKHRPHPTSTPVGDPLVSLARRYGGSKRNALLKWCQEKTQTYTGIDITNFSSSWSDGLAFCALLHSYLPAHIPYDSLQQTYISAPDDKSRGQLQAKNFRLAFAAAESVGIEPTLAAEDLSAKDRPDWQRVMCYVTQIYKYFET